MKNLAIIIFLLCLIGCESPKGKTDRQVKEYPELSFGESISLGGGIYRYENSEAICYTEYDAGLQWKFKGSK